MSPAVPGVDSVAPSGLPATLTRISEIRGAAVPTPPPSDDGGAAFALPRPDVSALSAAALGGSAASTGYSAHSLGGLPGPGPAHPGIAPAPAGGGTVHPLAGQGEVIGRPHAGTHTLGNWQSDNAIDWRVPEGTPIYAVSDGVVGARIGPLGSSASRFAGERLTLEAPGNAYYYAHLSDIVVGPGQPVVRGQLLGFSGSANGVPHLHFGQRVGDPLAELVGP